MENLEINNENFETVVKEEIERILSKEEKFDETVKLSDKEEAAEPPENGVQSDTQTEENNFESQVSSAVELAPPYDVEEPTFPTLELPKPVFDFRNNISMFGYSQQGESHKQKNSPCQDRSNVRFIGNDENTLILAAVADGVGSCALSHFGSECAINSSLDYLQEKLQNEINESGKFEPTKEKMKKFLQEAMMTAVESVRNKADEMEQYEFSYQSTLTIAVYDGENLYFSHAGDDGIVVLLSNGKYAMATSRHKGEEASSVYPLQSISTHQFGMANGAVVGFVLATDGVLDAFVKSEAEENRVYYPFIQPVFEAEPTSKEEVKEICDAWYNYMAGETYRRSVVDDLSFVCVVNHSAVKTAVPPVFDFEEWNKKSKEYAEKRNAALYGNQAQPKKQNAVSQTDSKQENVQPQTNSVGNDKASEPDTLVQNGSQYQNNAVYQSSTTYQQNTPSQNNYQGSTGGFSGQNSSQYQNSTGGFSGQNGSQYYWGGFESSNASAYQTESTNQHTAYTNDNPQQNGYTDYINSQSDPRNDYERFTDERKKIAQAIGKGMTAVGKAAVEQGEKIITAGQKIQENANNGNKKSES